MSSITNRAADTQTQKPSINQETTARELQLNETAKQTDTEICLNIANKSMSAPSDFEQRHSTSSSSSSSSSTSSTSSSSSSSSSSASGFVMLANSSQSSGFVQASGCSNSMTSIANPSPTSTDDSPSSEKLPFESVVSAVETDDASSAANLQDHQHPQNLLEPDRGDKIVALDLFRAVDIQCSVEHSSQACCDTEISPKSLDDDDDDDSNESIRNLPKIGSSANESNIVTLIDVSRLERSNSCSQADEAASMAAAAAAAAAANKASSGCIATQIQANSSSSASISHENLYANAARASALIGAQHSNNHQHSLLSSSDAFISCASQQQDATNTLKPPQACGQKLGIEQQNSSPKWADSTSSRFFSSRLNTGSLWSLLSVASNSGASNNSPKDQPAQPDQGPENSTLASACNEIVKGAKQQVTSSSGYFAKFQASSNQTKTTSQKPDNKLRQLSNELQPQEQSMGSSNSVANQRAQYAPHNANLERKRYRFPLKYVGSSMLHKNFTLSMLEWIVKDIKRQTTKGGTQGRQFTIATRDIILEIQSYQLMAINMRDGHCIFMHPMSCVSKYAQLQLDPTCFAYIIRDSKESPQFCHVFQAKSANKVHEIFWAIREATTSSQRLSQQQQQQQASNAPSSAQLVPSLSASQQHRAQANQLVQRSASADAGPSAQPSASYQHPTGLQRTDRPEVKQKSIATSTAALVAAAAELKQAPVSSGRDCSEEALNFENSYQFEVMFVKRVKLQCRRVPASFVDDALETLKSFEVLKKCESKAAQIKGANKSRGIINISVDERQEYDEACQSPTPGQQARLQLDSNDEIRRNSLNIQSDSISKKPIDSEGSRSCQQSPTRHQTSVSGSENATNTDTDSNTAAEDSKRSSDDRAIELLKKHQSMDGLNTALAAAARYSNDFSPYNTITSTGLNERIAAIPVVSHGSVSLDHETRQRLARQVRETIQATAANIKKDVYASGSDKLKTSLSLKAIDSLSCTVSSEVPSIDSSMQPGELHPAELDERDEESNHSANEQQRRLSGNLIQKSAPTISASNNFDAFRRASARQVVKNRTMLLLIGKDELCAISIDKHQMLFNKSFTQILHCLQGNTNRDHFGIICRDSGKINPNAESHAGFIFKCQSEKVVREVMSALKQVIYSSQHNYHGCYSPYNPLNSNKLIENSAHPSNRAKFANEASGLGDLAAGSSGARNQMLSLAAKRGFSKPIEINDDSTRQMAGQIGPPESAASSAPLVSGGNSPGIGIKPTGTKQDIIKSMFCDNCPLYWFHRLCCDIDSLPAEASKQIILRRIDSSLSEKEQDEVYSNFSKYEIESVDEHNEIFMSILRHLCEAKQLKHSQSQTHLSAMAKNHASLKSSTGGRGQASSSKTGSQPATSAAPIGPQRGLSQQSGHQRSGSTGAPSMHKSFHDSGDSTPMAGEPSGSTTMDNLKRAKNSISNSIENMLKRRLSARDDDLSEAGQVDQQPATNAKEVDSLTRSGSFKLAGSSRMGNIYQRSEANSSNETIASSSGSFLKRSQSSSDSCGHRSSQTNLAQSWKDSLTRTINDDLANPFAGLFRRRSSTLTGADQSASRPSQSAGDTGSSGGTFRTSAECLSCTPMAGNSSPRLVTTPNLSASNDAFQTSSMLSSAFWKKSIFDKIRQPPEVVASLNSGAAQEAAAVSATRDLPAGQQQHQQQQPQEATKRSGPELRAMWKKAIQDQITLLKMDKQNQRLMQQARQPSPCNLAEQNDQLERVKLNYKDISHAKEAPALWNRILKQNPAEKVQFVEVARLVRLGVPKKRRGEAWTFLMNQYQLRHGVSYQPPDNEFSGDANQAYRSLLSQLSVQQHEIFVDIGRTFPTHPYYSHYLSIGQLSLFNLLKAYSLLDQEVGYCQGLSFVAGILLLHVDSEDDAFELMRHLLFNFGLRKQYLPSMNALHLQLYQITRLLRDHEYKLFNHFDHYDISPSLYAAPWFLTLFASQFPIYFVARLLDLIFLIGIEAIFRVSLNLLAHHRESILNCDGLEATMEYFRDNLIALDDKQLANIFDKSFSMDLRNELIEYEIEYTFYCAEDHRAKSTSNRDSYKPKQNSLVKSRPQQVDDIDATDRMSLSAKSDHKDGHCDTTTDNPASNNGNPVESTSLVANATATVIIQHLLSNNHLKSLRTDYTY